MRRPVFMLTDAAARLARGGGGAAARAAAVADPEFLEFLGESAGEDPELVLFMSTREARRALKDVEKEELKEDHDE